MKGTTQRYLARMVLYMWELTALPFIVNTAIRHWYVAPFTLSVILTFVTVGIPNVFCGSLTNFEICRKWMGIKDIPSLNHEKVVRKHNFGYLLFLNLFLDIIAHLYIYWYIATTFITDNDTGALIESHLYSNYIMDFIIPALLIEVCYDFIYYWWHYYGHKNAFMWKNVHNTHHEVVYPRYLDVYHMSLIETVFIRVSCYALHRFFRFPMNKFSTVVLVQHYVVMAEMIGHSGFDIEAEDMMIIRWILNQFGLTIDVKHHDYHHQKCGTNYSKRLAIWDKLFGTFYDPQLKN